MTKYQWLFSTTFSFPPFRKIFEKSWIQFHLSPVYLQQKQIYMFYNDNLPLVANIKFVGYCVAKSWQLRKDHSGTGGPEWSTSYFACVSPCNTLDRGRGRVAFSMSFISIDSNGRQLQYIRSNSSLRLCSVDVLTSSLHTTEIGVHNRVFVPVLTVCLTD